MVLRGRELQRDWADWRRTPDPYAGSALSAVFGLLQNRLRPEGELAAAVAARLRGTPALLEAGRENLDPALASPVLLRRSLGQIGAGAAYSRSVAAEFGGDRTAEALVADAGEVAAAAFEELGAHVEAMVEGATGDWAIGEERYAALLREAEGLPYGARELHEKGLALYDELAADMRLRAQDAARHRRLPRGAARASTTTTPRPPRRCWRSTRRPPTRPARSASSTTW